MQIPGVVPVLLLLLLLATAACRLNEAAVERAGDGGAGEATATAVPATEAPVEVESGGPITIENGDGPPFYARFGENETFGDGEQVVVVFYRPTECIPSEFNLNQFFHFPGESGPGAFACAPPTIDSVETWANGPETDPAPLVSEMTGRGSVPVWFFDAEEMATAMADEVVTIAELADLPSRRVGTASTYTELLHPSQTNETSLVQFAASGTLADGGEFEVDVSQGDPHVEDHVTIESMSE